MRCNSKIQALFGLFLLFFIVIKFSFSRSLNNILYGNDVSEVVGSNIIKQNYVYLLPFGVYPPECLYSSISSNICMFYDVIEAYRDVLIDLTTKSGLYAEEDSVSCFPSNNYCNLILKSIWDIISGDFMEFYKTYEIPLYSLEALTHMAEFKILQNLLNNNIVLSTFENPNSFYIYLYQPNFFYVPSKYHLEIDQRLLTKYLPKFLSVSGFLSRIINVFSNFYNITRPYLVVLGKSGIGDGLQVIDESTPPDVISYCNDINCAYQSCLISCNRHTSDQNLCKYYCNSLYKLYNTSSAPEGIDVRFIVLYDKFTELYPVDISYLEPLFSFNLTNQSHLEKLANILRNYYLYYSFIYNFIRKNMYLSLVNITKYAIYRSIYGDISLQTYIPFLGQLLTSLKTYFLPGLSKEYYTLIPYASQPFPNAPNKYPGCCVSSTILNKVRSVFNEHRASVFNVGLDIGYAGMGGIIQIVTRSDYGNYITFNSTLLEVPNGILVYNYFINPSIIPSYNEYSYSRLGVFKDRIGYLLFSFVKGIPFFQKIEVEKKSESKGFGPIKIENKIYFKFSSSSPVSNPFQYSFVEFYYITPPKFTLDDIFAGRFYKATQSINLNSAIVILPENETGILLVKFKPQNTLLNGILNITLGANILSYTGFLGDILLTSESLLLYFVNPSLCKFMFDFNNNEVRIDNLNITREFLRKLNLTIYVDEKNTLAIAKCSGNCDYNTLVSNTILRGCADIRIIPFLTPVWFGDELTYLLYGFRYSYVFNPGPEIVNNIPNYVFVNATLFSNSLSTRKEEIILAPLNFFKPIKYDITKLPSKLSNYLFSLKNPMREILRGGNIIVLSCGFIIECKNYAFENNITCNNGEFYCKNGIEYECINGTWFIGRAGECCPGEEIFRKEIKKNGDLLEVYRAKYVCTSSMEWSKVSEEKLCDINTTLYESNCYCDNSGCYLVHINKQGLDCNNLIEKEKIINDMPCCTDQDCLKYLDKFGSFYCEEGKGCNVTNIIICNTTTHKCEFKNEKILGYDLEFYKYKYGIDVKEDYLGKLLEVSQNNYVYLIFPYYVSDDIKYIFKYVNITGWILYNFSRNLLYVNLSNLDDYNDKDFPWFKSYYNGICNVDDLLFKKDEWQKKSDEECMCNCGELAYDIQEIKLGNKEFHVGFIFNFDEFIGNYVLDVVKGKGLCKGNVIKVNGIKKCNCTCCFDKGYLFKDRSYVLPEIAENSKDEKEKYYTCINSNLYYVDKVYNVDIKNTYDYFEEIQLVGNRGNGLYDSSKATQFEENIASLFNVTKKDIRSITSSTLPCCQDLQCPHKDWYPNPNENISFIEGIDSKEFFSNVSYNRGIMLNKTNSGSYYSDLISTDYSWALLDWYCNFNNTLNKKLSDIINNGEYFQCLFNIEDTCKNSGILGEIKECDASSNIHKVIFKVVLRNYYDNYRSCGFNDYCQFLGNLLPGEVCNVISYPDSSTYNKPCYIDVVLELDKSNSQPIQQSSGYISNIACCSNNDCESNVNSAKHHEGSNGVTCIDCSEVNIPNCEWFRVDSTSCTVSDYKSERIFSVISSGNWYEWLKKKDYLFSCKLEGAGCNDEYNNIFGYCGCENCGKDYKIGENACKVVGSSVYIGKCDWNDIGCCGKWIVKQVGTYIDPSTIHCYCTPTDCCATNSYECGDCISTCTCNSFVTFYSCDDVTGSYPWNDGSCIGNTEVQCNSLVDPDTGVTYYVCSARASGTCKKTYDCGVCPSGDCTDCCNCEEGCTCIPGSYSCIDHKCECTGCSCDCPPPPPSDGDSGGDNSGGGDSGSSGSGSGGGNSGDNRSNS